MKLSKNFENFITFENIYFLAYNDSFTTLNLPLFIEKHFFSGIVPLQLKKVKLNFKGDTSVACN